MGVSLYFLVNNACLGGGLKVGSLHFCGLYLLLAETILNPAEMYAVVLALFFAVYGLACAVSMVRLI